MEWNKTSHMLFLVPHPFFNGKKNCPEKNELENLELGVPAGSCGNFLRPIPNFIV
jgi:hypothetical protein